MCVNFYFLFNTIAIAGFSKYKPMGLFSRDEGGGGGRSAGLSIFLGCSKKFYKNTFPLSPILKTPVTHRYYIVTTYLFTKRPSHFHPRETPVNHRYYRKKRPSTEKEKWSYRIKRVMNNKAKKTIISPLVLST